MASEVIDAVREAVRKPLQADGEIYWAAEYGRPIPDASIDAIVSAALDALAANVSEAMVEAMSNVRDFDGNHFGASLAESELRALAIAALTAAKETGNG